MCFIPTLHECFDATSLQYWKYHCAQKTKIGFQSSFWLFIWHEIYSFFSWFATEQTTLNMNMQMYLSSKEFGEPHVYL